MLAIERRQLGEELHLVRGKLEAAVTEYDKEQLLRDIAEERREGRARTRASSARASGDGQGAASRSVVSGPRSRDLSRDSLERRPLRGPSVEMYRFS